MSNTIDGMVDRAYNEHINYREHRGVMKKLPELLKKRMETEKLSLRDIAKKTNISHATVARAVNGETVKIDTLITLAEFLGVPVEDLLDVKDKPSDIMQQIVMVLSIEPELTQVFTEIAQKIENDKTYQKVLAEVAAFAAYRLDITNKKVEAQAKAKKQAAVSGASKE